MAEIVYEYGESLYVNLTNRCPCRCTFCVRAQRDGLGTADSLWLTQEPTADEVMEELEAHGLLQRPEVVFCGYGEPFCALETLLEVCRRVRALCGAALRINTNGLGDLICGRRTAPLLERLVDVVSVSLNAPDAARYAAVTRPQYGEAAFDAMLAFARDCKQFVPDVRFTIVDVLPQDEIAACKAVADAQGVPLRIRHYTE